MPSFVLRTLAAVLLLGRGQSSLQSAVASKCLWSTRYDRYHCNASNDERKRQKLRGRVSKGTLVTLDRVTPGRAFRWFCPSNAEKDLLSETETESTQYGWETIVNHDCVGITRGTDTTQGARSTAQEQSFLPRTSVCTIPHKDWRVLRLRRRIGSGRKCYQRVRDAAMAWTFSSPGNDKGMVVAVDVENTRGRDKQEQFARLPLGQRMATYTSIGLPFLSPRWVPRLNVVSPVILVYNAVDQKQCQACRLCSMTSYATAQGHWLRGEEQVTVMLRDDPGASVDVEILSYSKPAANLMGKLSWPFVAKPQRQFFVQQMEAFQNIAKDV